MTARYFNLIKLFSGYLYSRITGHVVQWGYPAAISVEPTNRCNLHCPECPSGSLRLTRERGFIDPDLFSKIINQLSRKLLYLTIYFQGEPFLHRDLFKMIRMARDNGINVMTSTNGHFLTHQTAIDTVESGLNKLIISVDGTTQESYEIYRKGGHLEDVFYGIRELISIKKEKKSKFPETEVQFIVFKHNEHQIEEIKRKGTELGVDRVVIKTAQLYDFENGHVMMTGIDRYSRYKSYISKEGTKKYAPKNTRINHCWRMYSSAVFTWEGDVVPCCYDKDAGYRMGNLKTSSFNEIWKGKAYRKFRKSIFTSQKEIAICSNCDQKI